MKDAQLAGAGIHSRSVWSERITWGWGGKTNDLLSYDQMILESEA